MGLNLQLSALTLPSGTEFPGTPQGLLDLIAAYMEIIGGESFSGINYGDVVPDPANQDRPWFKTDGSGNPIGWFGWNGSAWVPIPLQIPSGGTGARPSAPGDGTLYFDTDINVELIYYGGSWHTASGSPGDVKEVKAANLAAALLKNPGWSSDTASIGMVISGALADGTDYNIPVGDLEVVLTEAQMPAHIHNDIVLTGSSADIGDPGPLVITNPAVGNGPHTITSSSTGSTGGSDPVSLLQPTVPYWRLVKD